VIGAGHRQHAVENQDAYRCLRGRRWVIGVVADGHGAREHPRSAAGSRLAADLLAGELLRGLDDPAQEGPLCTDRVQELGKSFLTAWKDAVAQALISRPLSDRELENMVAGADPISAYGTTALALTVSDEHLGALAIGDGRLGWVDRRGRHHELCAAPGRIGEATDSLASTNAADAMRCETHPTTDVTAAWACTDGFSNAQVEADWPHLVAAQLQKVVGTATENDLSDRLVNWLTPSATEGGDDTTMVVAWATR
jgi:serine/threonine protein phosphatase PrpC